MTDQSTIREVPVEEAKGKSGKFYRVWLHNSYNGVLPWTCEWDVYLMGPKLREEFLQYFKKWREEVRAAPGARRKILPAVELQKFMQRKRINLVDDPVTGGLKSVFVLKEGQKKLIDEDAYKSLKRLERRNKKVGDEVSDYEGFLVFEEVDPKKKAEVKVKQGTEVDVYSEKVEGKPRKSAEEYEKEIEELKKKMEDLSNQGKKKPEDSKEKKLKPTQDKDGWWECPYKGCNYRNKTRVAVFGHMTSHKK